MNWTVKSKLENQVWMSQLLCWKPVLSFKPKPGSWSLKIKSERGNFWVESRFYNSNLLIPEVWKWSLNEATSKLKVGFIIQIYWVLKFEIKSE